MQTAVQAAHQYYKNAPYRPVPDASNRGIVLSRASQLKRLLKADAARREVFVREYAFLHAGAEAGGATIFFADEAHFYADADPPGK